MLTVVHAADLHLDSPLRGLERYEGAPVEAMREATRQALENLVELCLAEGAQLLLLAGDIYDGDWKDYATGLFFARQMSALREGGVQVVIVRGNHDAASVVRKHLSLPDHVKELRSRAPETLELETLGVAVHGQSYPKRAVTEDLAEGYPDAISGVVNLGLLHTCATGRPGHERYAPCRLETLHDKGYDYWALGHIHQREVLSRDPWVVFPGNLQGRHVRECGPKGATVLKIEDRRILSVSERVVDAARWEHLQVNVSEAGDGFEVVDRVRAALEEARQDAGGRPVAARVTLGGRTRAHGALLDDSEGWESRIRGQANDLGQLWVERIRFRTEAPFDLVELSSRDDAIGQVVRALDALPSDDKAVAGLVEELAEVARKLPRELREEDGLRLDSPSEVHELLGDVKHLLLERLLATSRESG